MIQLWEKLISKVVIPNLSAYLVAITGIVSAIALAIPGMEGLGSMQPSPLFGGEWINLLFYPFRIYPAGLFGNPWLGLLLYIFIFYMFSSWLEGVVGDLRFNAYVYLGILILTLSSLLLPIPAYGLYLSIFLAIAVLDPDKEILLYFILPVKIKWLAIIMAGLFSFTFIQPALAHGTIVPIIMLLLSLANFFIYFGPEFITQRKRKSQNRTRKAQAKPQLAAIHKCFVCGKTEHDDQELEFRFCVECEDHEYCMEHLYTHDHR